MKLSNMTIDVIKNFSTINTNLVLSEGSNVIKTMNLGKNVFAMATVPDEFPVQAVFNDVTKFLSVYKAFEEPEVEFDRNSVDVSTSDGKSVVRMLYADIRNIVYPEKDLKLPSEDLSFDLEEEDFKKLLRFCDILSLPNIRIRLNDDNQEELLVESYNAEVKNSTDTYSVNIKDGYLLTNENTSFVISLDREHMKMIPGNYKITVSFAGVAKFENKDVDVTYFVALNRNNSKLGK